MNKMVTPIAGREAVAHLSRGYDGTLRSLDASRPAPSPHQARQAQMRNRVYSSLDETWSACVDGRRSAGHTGDTSC